MKRRATPPRIRAKSVRVRAFVYAGVFSIDREGHRVRRGEEEGERVREGRTDRERKTEPEKRS